MLCICCTWVESTNNCVLRLWKTNQLLIYPSFLGLYQEPKNKNNHGDGFQNSTSSKLPQFSNIMARATERLPKVPNSWATSSDITGGLMGEKAVVQKYWVPQNTGLVKGKNRLKPVVPKGGIFLTHSQKWPPTSIFFWKLWRLTLP